MSAVRMTRDISGYGVAMINQQEMYDRAVDRALAMIIESAQFRGEVAVGATPEGELHWRERMLHRSHESVFQAACELAADYFREHCYDEEGYLEGADEMEDAGIYPEADWEEATIRRHDREQAGGYWPSAARGEGHGVGHDGLGGDGPCDPRVSQHAGPDQFAGEGGGESTGCGDGTCCDPAERFRALFFQITVQCGEDGGVQVDRESSGHGDTQECRRESD